MRKQLRIIVCALLFLIFSMQYSAQAWDATGHMLIAQIAYDNLSNDVRQRIQEKLEPLARGNAPYNFVTAAAWMDDIKNDPQNPWKNLSRLHYVDIPYSKNGENFQIPSGENSVTALRQTIKGIQQGDANAELQARQWAMIIHLVGDIHQPLHCADNRDRGGNDVLVKGVPDTPPWIKSYNLHAFWDTAYRYDVVDDAPKQLYYGLAIKNRPKQPGRGFIASEAQKLIQKYPSQKEIPAYSEAEIVNWAQESYQIACQVAYAPILESETTPVFLDNKYIHNAHESTALRLVFAGMRLSKLLQWLDANSA